VEVDKNSAPVAARHGGGAWTAIAPGWRVPVGAEVRAAADAGAGITAPARLILASGAEIELAAGARAKVLPTLDVAFGAAGHAKCALVDLAFGEIQVDVPAAASGSCVVVIAEAARVAVRAGAKALVRTEAEGANRELAAAVVHGDVRGSSGAAWTPFFAGHTAVVAQKGRPSASVPMREGPAWIQEDAFSTRRPLAIVTGGTETATLSARFAPGTDAHGHLVELAADAAFEDVLARGDAPGDATVVTPPLPVGRYFARVRARDAHGLPGLPGPARELRVERLILPSGAVAEPSAFILPLGQTARFENASGIELALGPRGYHSSPSAFGLGTETAVVARARLAGDRWSVPIRFEPSTLHADIDLEPKTAIWPRDAIDITVTIADEHRPVPSFEPALQVRVGIDEVPVEWRREGQTWRARLAPQPTPGPWVVRVEATDPHGATLGRGHLEVIAAR